MANPKDEDDQEIPVGCVFTIEKPDLDLLEQEFRGEGAFTNLKRGVKANEYEYDIAKRGFPKAFVETQHFRDYPGNEWIRPDNKSLFFRDVAGHTLLAINESNVPIETIDGVSLGLEGITIGTILINRSFHHFTVNRGLVREQRATSRC